MLDRHVDRSMTAEQLKLLLHYSPKYGIFRWRDRTDIPAHVNKRFSGKKAGYVNDERGYIRIGINGAAYYAQDLAWLYMTGEWAPTDVDHKDAEEGNNVWSNLRLATHRQNGHNAKKHKRLDTNSTARKKGARFHKMTGRWQASIFVDGISKYLGLHDTQDLAHEAYCDAALHYFGQFARFD